MTAAPTDRYAVRSTNFSRGPRHVILDRELDAVVESFSTRAEAEACLSETFRHLGLTRLADRPMALVR